MTSAKIAERADELSGRLKALEAREEELSNGHIQAITSRDRAAEEAARAELAAVRTEAAALVEAKGELARRLRVLRDAEAREVAAHLLPKLLQKRKRAAKVLADEWGARGFDALLETFTEQIRWLRNEPHRINALDAEIAALVAAFDLPSPVLDPTPTFDTHGCADAVLELKASLDRSPFRHDMHALLERAQRGDEAAFGRFLELIGDDTAALLQGRLEALRDS